MTLPATRQLAGQFPIPGELQGCIIGDHSAGVNRLGLIAGRRDEGSRGRTLINADDGD